MNSITVIMLGAWLVLLTQHLVMVSVFISCFTAHRTDVWALGAQGYFSTPHFINLLSTFNTHVHTSTHKITSVLHESLDLLWQVTNQVWPASPIKKCVWRDVGMSESLRGSIVRGRDSSRPVQLKPFAVLSNRGDTRDNCVWVLCVCARESVSRP